MVGRTDVALDLVLAAGLSAGVAALATWWWAGRAAPPPPPAPTAPPPSPFDAAEDVWTRGGDGWTAWRRGPDGWRPAPRPDPAGPRRAPFPPTEAWARSRSAEPAVATALAAWSEAGLAASRVGWLLDLPAGDRLFDAWLAVAEPTERPADAFATWFVGALGTASRRGLDDRETAERRDVVARTVLRACARVVEALDPDLRVEVEAPIAVGARDAERWLVDRSVAARLANAGTGELVRPMLALRPLLRRGDRVLLEGEVA